jgi:hypothetical protein
MHRWSSLIGEDQATFFQLPLLGESLNRFWVRSSCAAQYQRANIVSFTRFEESEV